MSLDITEASEPPLIHADIPAELPITTVALRDKPIVPLDLEENPRLRSKLRLYIILTALYVSLTLPLPSV